MSARPSDLPRPADPKAVARYTLWIFDGLRWEWVTNLESVANAKLVLNRYTRAISAVVKLKGYSKRKEPPVARFYKENGIWLRGKV